MLHPFQQRSTYLGHTGEQAQLTAEQNCRCSHAHVEGSSRLRGRNENLTVQHLLQVLSVSLSTAYKLCSLQNTD